MPLPRVWNESVSGVPLYQHRLVYLKLTVPVAQGQVIKPSELWALGVNWIGSLSLIGIEAIDGAMRQPDSDQAGFADLIVHPGGRVIQGTTIL